MKILVDTNVLIDYLAGRVRQELRCGVYCHKEYKGLQTQQNTCHCT